jgi:squalene cyclase
MIKEGINGLAFFLHQAVQQRVDTVRLARASYALLASGCSVKGTFPDDTLASNLVTTQQGDGGWVDVEETIWCLGYLAAFGERYRKPLVNGKKWLASVQLPCGAWGKSGRDQPRIPVTALASILVPESVETAALKWLAQQWEAELSSSIQLTYKGAFFLLAHAYNHAFFDGNLVRRTTDYLKKEQEEDGGFSPWKGHPVGSDPWSTGIVLWGLSRLGKLAPRQTIERALSWLKSKQLPNGLWPYHYLDDGTAMALIGISNVLHFGKDL